MSEAKPITVKILDKTKISSLNEIRGIRTEGIELQYVEGRILLSTCDGTSKYTKGAQTCLVPFLVGTGKETSSELSIIGHLSGYMDWVPGYFRDQFQDQLRSFFDITIPGTCTAAIVAGHVPPSGHKAKDRLQADFIRRVGMIRDQIQDVLGLRTTVLAGPTRTPGATIDVYCDTQKRAVCIVPEKPTDIIYTIPFCASEVESVSSGW